MPFIRIFPRLIRSAAIGSEGVPSTPASFSRAEFARLELARLSWRNALAFVLALSSIAVCAVVVAFAYEAPTKPADLSGQSLKVGVSYLPPPDTPDMRYYIEEGFELAIAQELGGKLGANIALVRIAEADQAAALADGRVDAVIARVAPDAPIAQSARLVETGFESGLSLAMRSDTTIRSWTDLKGRTICIPQANVHGRSLAERHGATVREVRAPAVALMLVRTGECDAALHDRAVLDPLFDKPSWTKFSATLPPVEKTALVVAVAPQRRDVAEATRRALAELGTRERWQLRAAKWASTVSFEVYRDQVAADCH